MLERQYPDTPSALSGHWRYPCFNENWKRSRRRSLYTLAQDHQSLGRNALRQHLTAERGGGKRREQRMQDGSRLVLMLNLHIYIALTPKPEISGE